jgi:deoxyhypusine synthase
VTAKNELQSIWKEEVLVFLMTASIRNEGMRKGVKDLIQNQIFGCAKREAENLIAQLLRSMKEIFIFILCLHI